MPIIIRRPLQKITKAYLLGALHDSTERKTTFRISQKSKEYVELIAQGIRKLGYSAWIYREGKKRNVYIVEFSKSIINAFNIETQQDKIDYIRGYFDAEGGIARKPNVRYYLYFAQKNLPDLKEVKNYLEEIGINCGKIHNPSKRVDPNYWRFYIRAESYKDFARIIGSSHPVKKYFLRVKR
jgi:intein-encoded DNA endonuclease-like protein